MGRVGWKLGAAPLAAVTVVSATVGLLLGGAGSLAATTTSSSVTQQNSPSTSISSTAFSTQPNTLVVALLGTDGPTSGGQRFTGVGGGGLSWHLATFSK